MDDGLVGVELVDGVLIDDGFGPSPDSRCNDLLRYSNNDTCGLEYDTLIMDIY